MRKKMLKYYNKENETENVTIMNKLCTSKYLEKMYMVETRQLLMSKLTRDKFSSFSLTSFILIMLFE